MAVPEKLNVIIVGAGYAGLAAAIELARKGAKVKVYESVAQLTNQGDVVQIASNASRVFHNWGNVLQKVQAGAGTPSVMRCQNEHGRLLLEQDLPREFDGFPVLYCNRGLAQRVFYEHAVALGVEFQFGARITDVFDDETGAGVWAGEERRVADLVVVADGVHSKGRAYVAGAADRPRSSGFAVYRSWFPMERLRGDPKLEEIVNSKGDLFRVWIGMNTHGMVVTNVALQTVVCFYTHKDTYDVEESWAFPGRVEDMLKATEGWDETLRAVIRRIPPEILIDYKLLWRDPTTKWVSDNRRVVLVGDAAHPHLATSGQGAAQAIEDGATLAAVLDRAGKSNVPLALKAFEKLRCERTSLTQRMGWELREVWHHTPWELVAANPEMLKMPQPAWLFGHDPEKYAYENYEAVTEFITKGTEFKNTNVPEGYVHEDWTIESMLAKERLQEEEAKKGQEAQAATAAAGVQKAKEVVNVASVLAVDE